MNARHLTCAQCSKEFEHPFGPGRIPIRCLECRAKQKEWRAGLGQSSYRLTEKDFVIIGFIMEHLGVSQAEAIRTSLRVYHAILLKDQK